MAVSDGGPLAGKSGSSEQGRMFLACLRDLRVHGDGGLYSEQDEGPGTCDRSMCIIRLHMFNSIRVGVPEQSVISKQKAPGRRRRGHRSVAHTNYSLEERSAWGMVIGSERICVDVAWAAGVVPRP